MDFFVWQRSVVDEAGNILASASVSVTDVVSGALAQLYSDEGVTGIGNPITADSNGFAQFYVKAGVYDIIASLGGDSRTWSDEAIGAPHKRTAAEIAAGLTPTNYQHNSGFVERLGALGDGSTVDDTAFTNTLATNVEVTGGLDKTFVLSSGISLPTERRIIRFTGSIIRPDDSNGRFVDSPLSATATSTVSSGASMGSRSVVVASASGMAVGHFARVTESTDEWPAFWGRITSVSGTTLEFDRALPATYAGTINISTYDSLRGEFVAADIEWDGSNVSTSPGNDGHVFRLVGRERVVIERLTLRNFDFSTGGFVVQVLDCPDVEILQVRVIDSTIGDQVNFINVDRARGFLLGGMQAHSGGFGVNAFRCESAIFQGNILCGRRKMEDEESITARSTRGLKAFGCGYVTMTANDVSDYESPIKIERIHRFVVTGNTVRNAAMYTYDGSIALSVTSVSDPVEPYGLICNNLIENVPGGIGIGVDSGGGTSLDINVIVSDNIIKDVGKYAIYCANRKIMANGNKIQNWNTSNDGTGENSAAIYYESGVTAIGNTFENTDATDACFRANFVAGEEYCFRDNSILTGNPYFNGGLFIEYNGGTATIASGSTSVAVNHSLVRTPAQIEIDLQYATNPTNDPGPIFLSSITSTQITVACRNDPGSGGFNVHWKARIRQPFTA